MDKPRYIAHVNCSPWIEDGEWNIVHERDYHSFTGIDSDDAYDMLDKILVSALDTGSIHSYYIQRAKDPVPVKHAQ